DAHVRTGLNCTDCHPLVNNRNVWRLSHQIAKGKSLTGHVRDDLDGAGMKTCVACHSEGLFRGAKQARDPKVLHAKLLEGAQFHTYLVSCQSRHMTGPPLRALTILDMSTGRETGY